MVVNHDGDNLLDWSTASWFGQCLVPHDVLVPNQGPWHCLVNGDFHAIHELVTTHHGYSTANPPKSHSPNNPDQRRISTKYSEGASFLNLCLEEVTFRSGYDLNVNSLTLPSMGTSCVHRSAQYMILPMINNCKPHFLRMNLLADNYCLNIGEPDQCRCTKTHNAPWGTISKEPPAKCTHTTRSTPSILVSNNHNFVWPLMGHNSNFSMMASIIWFHFLANHLPPSSWYLQVLPI